MTHISEVEWVNLKKDKQAIFHQIKEGVHKFVVSSGELDNVRGVITIKRFWKLYQRRF